MERAAQDRDDWTLLRVTTPDRPGGLAVFARCMAACGVDILSIEILGHEGPKAVADVLVHGGDLDRALRALDEDLDLLGRRSHGDLPDPALAMADACGIVFADGTPAALLDACMRLVGADLGAVYRVAGGKLWRGRADHRGPRVARAGGARVGPPAFARAGRRLGARARASATARCWCWRWRATSVPVPGGGGRPAARRWGGWRCPCSADRGVTIARGWRAADVLGSDPADAGNGVRPRYEPVTAGARIARRGAVRDGAGTGRRHAL